jgi:hypothetical protein
MHPMSAQLAHQLVADRRQAYEAAATRRRFGRCRSLRTAIEAAPATLRAVPAPTAIADRGQLPAERVLDDAVRNDAVA